MEKRKKKIYLSLPISGYDLNERIERAKFVKEKFERMGYVVANPLENGIDRNAPTYVHMKRDLEMLLECDTVFFMEGWNHSAGCHTEFTVAIACGKEIMFETITKAQL